MPATSAPLASSGTSAQGGPSDRPNLNLQRYSAALQQADGGRRRSVTAGLLVLLAGAGLTVALTVLSEQNYTQNERSLVRLQTRLSSLVLSEAAGQVTGTLGRIVGLAADAPNPSAAFRTAAAPLVAARGHYAAASLIQEHNGKFSVLIHLGAPAFRSVNAAPSLSVLSKVATTPLLVTAHIVKGGEQRIVYLLSDRGDKGVFIVAVAQQLKADLRVNVPPSNPDVNLNFAVYFGAKTDPGDLVETNVAHLPLSGTVASATSPFGAGAITFVASPRGPLTGRWTEYAPWVILAAGLIISLGAAVVTQRLVKSRALAVSMAALNRQWYQRQRSVSEELQRALLPRALPKVPRTNIAARYLPSTRDTEIGGDWYSVVEVQDGKLAFVVGDVSGHGTAAAGTMASLRYGMKALGRIGLSPVQVLQAEGGDQDLGELEHFATALAGTIDLESRQLTIASAGHLPPLLVSGDRTELIAVDASPPIGVEGPSPVALSVDLSPGAMLIAFTDGLVERRGEDITDGLARLKAAAANGPREPEALVSHLLQAMLAGDNEDDIAVLVIQVPSTRADG